MYHNRSKEVLISHYPNRYVVFDMFLDILSLLIISAIAQTSLLRFLTRKLSACCLQLLLFGGHGTGGWLSRYDIYYNDCIVLDRGKCFFIAIISFLWRNISANQVTIITCLSCGLLCFLFYLARLSFLTANVHEAMKESSIS